MGMAIKLFADLRFVIGFFFLIISCILLALGIGSPPVEPTELNLNLQVGVVMIIFATLMMGFSIKSAKEMPK